MPKDEPVQIAGTILKDDKSRYLLVQETRPDIYGKWGLPAGHVDDGESVTGAAIRETQEETGYLVELHSEKPFFESVTENNHPYIIFDAKIANGELRVDPQEQLDVKWLTYDELKSMDLKGQLRDALVIQVIEKFESKDL